MQLGPVAAVLQPQSVEPAPSGLGGPARQRHSALQTVHYRLALLHEPGGLGRRLPNTEQLAG